MYLSEIMGNKGTTGLAY